MKKPLNTPLRNLFDSAVQVRGLPLPEKHARHVDTKPPFKWASLKP